VIQFHNLEFQEENGRLFLTKFGNQEQLHSGFAEVTVAGENKETHLGTKLVCSSEGDRLRYVSHEIDGNVLKIVQESPVVRVTSVFITYGDTNAVRVQTTVTNIAQEPIVLEEVSSFVVTGIGGQGRRFRPETMFLTELIQKNTSECQPQRRSFLDLGLYSTTNNQRRAGQVNIGNWTTKEAIPVGIIEDAENGNFLMYQIESNASWCCEVSDWVNEYYLWMGGGSLPFGSWSRELEPGESYVAPYAAVSFGSDLNSVIGEMTKYRRHIIRNFPGDENLPTIFNEYMHLSWDGPTAENTAKYAPVLAKTGVEYYVIDCGWHNEEDCIGIHHYMGQWKESKVRFPEGVRKTMDLIRSYGMKPGLWIEPEVVGWKCKEMIDYYDDDCFLHRNGKPLIIHSRRFLDYRHPKVRAYMSETIRFMVEDLSAEYIKFDYNHDYGVGTDSNAYSLGSGLEDCSNAFWNWVQEMAQKYPHVVFEGCASGGMRMDYKTLSAFAMVSTSDQTEYELYPYIAGNILAAVLPEQAAVWSYPVSDDCKASDDVSEDRIAINMINSLLGRMHLASHLERLDEKKMAMVKEGIAYYNYLAPIKKTAVPYFPMGFTTFYANHVCSGLRKENKVYLAVWCMAGQKQVQIPIKEGVADVRIAYPGNSRATAEITPEGVCVNFPNVQSAVFLEIQLQG